MGRRSGIPRLVAALPLGRAALAGLALLLAAAATSARADAVRYRPGEPIPNSGIERILNFHSAIVIEADGALTVTETIQVNARGRQIRQGIYRDVPTAYRGGWGLRATVGFAILDIRRDGRPEPYFTRDLDNGVRIFLGKRGVFPKPGLHTYRIRYRTTRQLGHFGDYDELYWNVTGHGWRFPIDRAEAVVTLPKGADIRARRAYTGRRGERGQDWYVVDAGPGRTGFVTNARLGLGRGLTIAVAWQKGLVPEPGAGRRLLWLLADNLGATAAAALLLLLFAYYLVAWLRAGRDPKGGTIIPRFEPPDGMSPAAVRYVTRMGYDKRAFAAAIINMAVHGFLRIKQTSDRTFILDKEPHARAAALSPGERAIAGALFGRTSQVRIGSRYSATVKKALEKHEERVREDYDSGYFLRNRGWRLGGLAFAVTGLVVAAPLTPDPGTALLLAGGLAIAVWVALAYLVELSRAIRNARRTAALVGSLLFLVAGVVGAAFAGAALWDEMSAPGMLAVALIAAAAWGFDKALKAPTRLGRRVLDQIEGLRMYMTVAERDRLDLINPPARTPETFERLLPYALALDVEQRWSERFADVLAAAGREEGGYAPVWLKPQGGHGFASTEFAASLGDGLSSSVSSAATPPGSSSGSGGSSGGGSSGGGGGGGGGW